MKVTSFVAAEKFGRYSEIYLNWSFNKFFHLFPTKLNEFATRLFSKVLQQNLLQFRKDIIHICQTDLLKPLLEFF